ncbi:hypothetical protein AN644_03305 [Candidatus Epulonipiscium fishelsonii]|nr:hypothetical protein AN644_03305 [Epulopiscium sp. SCG-C06WGA-EpuloA1]
MKFKLAKMELKIGEIFTDATRDKANNFYNEAQEFPHKLDSINRCVKIKERTNSIKKYTEHNTKIYELRFSPATKMKVKGSLAFHPLASIRGPSIT